MHEKDISNRPLRRRMGLPGAPPARSQSYRPPSALPLTRDHQRRLLRGKERLFVALAPPRLPSLAQRLPLLQAVPPGWHLGEDARRVARAGQGPSRKESSAQSATIVDSQSVKTTVVGAKERGYDERGYDGGK